MIVVADTSVIIVALVGQSELLRTLFREVLVPGAVRAEFRRLVDSGGRFAELELPAWVQIRAPASIPEAVVQHRNLHAGETEALALALEVAADAVLIDEAIGRAVAVALGLTPIGVLGILVAPNATASSWRSHR